MAVQQARKDFASAKEKECEKDSFKDAGEGAGDAGRRERSGEAQGPRLAAHAERPANRSPKPAPPPPPGDVKTLAARLNRLEERGRRLTLGMLLVGLLAAYTAWTQLAPGHDSVVKRTLTESSEVKLVDGSGATRMFLRVSSESPILQLLDRDGNTRLSLGMRLDETPFIDLSDKSGQTRATFELSEHDEPSLKLYDENGDPSFAIN